MVLGGAVALAGLAGVGASSERARRALPWRSDPVVDSSVGVPAAAEGQVRLESVRSLARGREVGLWSAVPAGLGDGRGLPVCLVLHGASATTADFSRFGLGRFLTAAVQAGAPPFVLVGADGGRSLWLGDGPGSADDPQRMLAEELPRWCAERGFDSARIGSYGWSMGGFGALRAAQLRPGGWRAVAALSPAVADGDAVLADADRLDPAATALWCGERDTFFPVVQRLAAAMPQPPAVNGHAPAGHTRVYWNSVTPDAFAFVGSRLSA